jgi:hypothetical protein
MTQNRKYHESVVERSENMSNGEIFFPVSNLGLEGGYFFNSFFFFLSLLIK